MYVYLSAPELYNKNTHHMRKIHPKAPMYTHIYPRRLVDMYMVLCLFIVDEVWARCTR